MSGVASNDNVVGLDPAMGGDACAIIQLAELRGYVAAFDALIVAGLPPHLLKALMDDRAVAAWPALSAELLGTDMQATVRAIRDTAAKLQVAL